MEIICFNQIRIDMLLCGFSVIPFICVLPLLVYLCLFAHMCVFVCLYTRTDYWKWRLKKPFLMPWRVFVECKRYFETQTHTSFLPQNNWGTGNAAPELTQEFEPGSRNNESVELVSPIATFSLYTQLNICLQQGELFILPFVCGNSFLSVFLISESEFRKGK